MGRKASRKKAKGANEPLRGIDFGWKSHDAIQAWTASVDSKTAIVLIIETAVTGAAARSLLSENGQLSEANGCALGLGIMALLALSAAVTCALWAVFPRLKRSKLKSSAPGGLIYFGHLKDRSASDIEHSLRGLTREEELAQLARQLAVTSSVAWDKHVWLQASIATFAVGVLLFAVALALA